MYSKNILRSFLALTLLAPTLTPACATVLHESDDPDNSNNTCMCRLDGFWESKLGKELSSKPVSEKEFSNIVNVVAKTVKVVPFSPPLSKKEVLFLLANRPSDYEDSSWRTDPTRFWESEVGMQIRLQHPEITAAALPQRANELAEAIEGKPYSPLLSEAEARILLASRPILPPTDPDVD